jgi:hypothetical protein
MRSSQHNHFKRSNVRLYDNDKIRKDVFKNLNMIPKDSGEEEKKIEVKGISTVVNSQKNRKTSKFQKK